jgi:hypothetical protein
LQLIEEGNEMEEFVTKQLDEDKKLLDEIIFNLQKENLAEFIEKFKLDGLINEINKGTSKDLHKKLLLTLLNFEESVSKSKDYLKYYFIRGFIL